MNLELHLSGPDATEKTTIAVEDWIRRERISELQVQRKLRSPEKGHMGVDPATILSVALGSAALVELVRSLHVWIKAARPKIKIDLKLKDAELSIDAENLPDQQSLENKVFRLLNRSEEV